MSSTTNDQQQQMMEKNLEYRVFDVNSDGVERRLYVDVINEDIDTNVWMSKVADPAAGAISSFIGTTRNNFKGKQVERLEYEAYIPMAIKEIDRICHHIFQNYTVLHIAVAHRIGLVPIGETSILIAISSAHRHDSLSAVQYGIDTLKATVPIWKKEFYKDGSISVWKDNCEACHYTTAPNHNQHHHH
ncbi:hypothetical protein SAMD00019534_033240 [Acytostelium subglobosum LB1]|uniref:hypothetical protein n=1 Tax=Acytostelium subglobosum LB1 TaxID=1410327 RepID=UPI00064481CC|nr:hypothetical protein SAMD00019534_033240 [Acytostelium subglobosum LB1]GAM20149.1 hypothetical protein SAMD00019534_033240 [Acytostelium subglobosum LB1]|eukprot:XP_012759670.1 hypothetical protein SAMD00019534_033240 [Acytostelium subglobosum LB1]